MTTDEQIYTGNNHIRGPRFHMSMPNPPVLLRDGNKEWLVEWHHIFGPSRLNKRTGDPLPKQPGEKDRFWLVAQWWKDQGAKVVDGVGQWKQPPIVEERYRLVGRKRVLDANGPFVAGRYYEGYERFGAIR